MKNKVFFISLVASFMLATSVLAQDSGKPLQPKPPRTAGLELTEEQIGNIQDLQLKLAKELIPLRSQLATIEASLQQELTSDQFNQSKVKSLIEQKVEFLSEMELQRLNNQRAVRDLLTPEQRKKFDLQVLKGGMRQRGMSQQGRRIGPRGPGMQHGPQAPGMNIPPPDRDTSKF